MKLLEAQNIRAGYAESDIVRDVSLSVEEGEIVGLLGANGTGKSTLLRVLSGLHTPRSGKVVFRGEDITGVPAERRVLMGLTMVPEGRQLFSGLSVEENLKIGATYTRSSAQSIEEDLEWILSIFPELKDKLRRAAGTMSGGEQQMAAIGRALMTHPSLLLIDELSLGLAPIVVQRLVDALRTIISQRRLSVVLVEQDVNVVLTLCSRTYLFAGGEIVREERSENLRADAELLEQILGIEQWG